MTTETSPADPDPRLLHAHDPAELLAEARICLGRTPRDSLLLFGHDGGLTSPLVTRSESRHLLASGGREQLENHLDLMRRRGCRGAYAVIVLGDGYESIDRDLLAEFAEPAGAVLLTTAATMLPEPFGIDQLWAVGGGQARELALTEGAVRHDTQEVRRARSSPPRALRVFSETRSASHAVLTGQPTPQDLPADGPLVLAAADLHLRRPGAGEGDAGELFAAGRAAVARLATGPGSDRRRYVTDCERLSSLLSAMGVDSLHWELLARCVDRGQSRRIDRELLLQHLTGDPGWRPDADVCAGGSWYTALEQLRVVARARGALAAGEQEELAEAAWRGLTVILVLLSWWNHRFATAGGLVDELWSRDPGSTLAPLLARLTDEPIAPAWWPHD